MSSSWIREEFGQEVADLAERFKANELSRRGFLRSMGILGLGATTAATVLAACAAEDTVDTTAPPDDPDATPPPVDPGEPVRGGTLREGYNRDISKHDPITTNWYDPAFYAIYEAVLSNAPDGSAVPQFASDWSVSDDGLTYTFAIPEGRTSHSGGTVDAQAVAEFYRTIQAESFIAGLAAPVDTYEAEGNSVIIRMKNPWIGALGPHMTGYWRIINIDTWKEAGGTDPASSYGTEFADGTGPFTHEEWVPGSHVLVRRWDDYPGSQTPFFENRGPAYLDAIRWSVILEAGQRSVLLENGDIDTLINPAHEDIPRLENNPDLTVIRHPEWSGYHLSMNRDYEEFFGDALTRQGLSHSLDRQGMVDAILAGNGAPTYGPFPTTDRYYDPAVEALNQFDIDLANQKLDEAGWTMGDDGIRVRDGVRFEFEYLVEDESVQRAVAEAVAQQFSVVGARATLNVVDRAVAFEMQSGEGRDAAAMSLFFWLWPIPIDVLTLFGGSQFIPVPNFSHAVEPTVDAAIEAWQNAATEDAAGAAASDFQLAWAEQLPFLPIMNQNATFVHHNRVHGWQPFVWHLYPYYNDTWLET